jgi:hypothetical protein
MEERKKEAFFSGETLARFVSAQGGTVEKVICHLWQNRINKNATVELVDNVVLEFSDRLKLTISCNEEGDGLDAIDFDFKQAAEQMQKEFGDNIRLFALDASSTKMWEDITGKVLKAVRLTKHNNNYLSDTLILDFGSEKREIKMSPLDGLIIDYHEED